jgi:signal transduction histidine kinase
LFYISKTTSAILHTAFLSFVMIISELLMALLISTVVHDYTAFKHNLAVMIALAVSSKLLYLLIVMAVAQYFKPRTVTANDPSFLFLLCVMPVASAVIAVGIVYIGLTFTLTKTVELFMAISALMLLVLNVVVLVVYRHIQEMNTEYTALQISSMRDRAYEEYYSMLQKQYESQRILVHDIKNHFVVLDNLAHENRTNDMIRYIAQLQSSPAFSRNIKFSDNPILNIILLRYSEYCRERHIHLECDIRADCISFVDETSLTSLFGNLLSNAVEAAETSQEKMIELWVKKTAQNQAVISLINSCDYAPTRDGNGLFKTRKKDAQNHGFGTKSIERITQKYNGIVKMYYDETEKKFHSIIYFLNVPDSQ